LPSELPRDESLRRPSAATMVVAQTREPLGQVQALAQYDARRNLRTIPNAREHGLKTRFPINGTRKAGCGKTACPV
jgi:hypothetical protein